MKRSSLKRAGDSWVRKGIISEAQLDQILALYPKREVASLLTIFSILLISIGFMTFIFSPWAQVPHFSRVILSVLFMTVLYMAGYIFHRRGQENLGISLLLLGFVAFGASMLLIVNVYSLILFSAWPFVLWTLMALLLFVFYEHPWIYFVGIIVLTAGQISSYAYYASFNFLLLALLLLGFAHFAYHRRDQLYSYLITISLAIQAIIFINVYEQAYYWLILYYLVIYSIGYLLRNTHMQRPVQQVMLVASFLLALFQAIVLHSNFLYGDSMVYSLSFFIIWLVIFSAISLLKISRGAYPDLVPLLLYLPVFYLPLANIFSLVVLFAFSLVYIILGYAYEQYNHVLYGSIAFLLSTLVAYFQFAWDILNKSLFFIIGGILLLSLSLVIERQRHLFQGKSGDNK